MSIVSRLNALYADTELNDLLARSGRVLSVRAIGLTLAFAVQILLVRLLGGAAEYGVFAWGRGLALFLAAIASLGLPKVALRFVAGMAGGDGVADTRALEWRVSRIIWMSSATIVVAGLSIALLWRRLELPLPEIALVPLLLALACVPPTALTRLQTQLARARRWVLLAYLPPQVLFPLFLGIGALLLWITGDRILSSSGALAVLFLAAAAVLSIQRVAYQRRARAQEARSGGGGPALPGTKEMWRVALPIFMTSSLGELIEQSGVLILGVLSGPEEAAIYKVAHRLSLLVLTPLLMVNAVTAPLYARFHAVGDTARMQRTVSLNAHLALWPALVTALLVVGGGRALLSLFGPEFAVGQGVLAILVASQAFRVAAGPGRILLNMTGHQTALVPALSVSAGLIVILNTTLVPRLGAAGAAIAAAVTMVAVTLSQWTLVRRRLGLDPTVLGRPPQRVDPAHSTPP